MIDTQNRFKSLLPEIGFKDYKSLVQRTGLQYSWDGFIQFDHANINDVAKIRVLCKWFR